MQARNRIAKRGLRIGIDIGEEVAKLQSVPWEERRQQVTDPHVQMPDYFNRRFHAYAEGNLSWEAAHQVTTFHAPSDFICTVAVFTFTLRLLTWLSHSRQGNIAHDECSAQACQTNCASIS